jgi:hypothetical protein
MSIAEVKERIAKMSLRQRREIQLYLIQLRHATPAWKKRTAKRIRDMQAGKGVSLEELQRRLKQ